MNGTENAWLVKFGELGTGAGVTVGDGSFTSQAFESAATAISETIHRIRLPIFLLLRRTLPANYPAHIRGRRAAPTVRLISGDRQG
ncbi:hypothetical protein [Kribbella sp. NBC_00359]|uniref:hypothetical protein n=1 Tax=Kribbella sp. NBC_00359 TaxID=2975966 RepID=UPI002E1A4ACA